MENKTNFKFLIYEVVKKIPRGSVLTYKQIAEKIGRPKSYRAVGSALGKNRDLSVPCHRVIRNDSNIGGYNRGVKKKKELLLRENTIFFCTKKSHKGAIFLIRDLC